MRISLFVAYLYCSVFAHRQSDEFAIFSDESLLLWSPYTINQACTRYVIAGVGKIVYKRIIFKIMSCVLICTIEGVAGLGDEIEQFIYAMNVAKVFEATVVIQGGLNDGSHIEHVGSSKYPEVATLLGIQPMNTAFESRDSRVQWNELEMTFQEVLEFKNSLQNGTARLPCNTIIRSYINSCDNRWCTLVAPIYPFLRNAAPYLRNNSARSTCLQWQKGFTDCHSPMVNVVWHVRTGDIQLHKKESYYDKVADNLLAGLAASRKDIGKSVNLVFESQLALPSLVKKFPHARFHIGQDIMDTVCTFLSSDVFVSSGSSFVTVLAFAPPHRPVVFEEVRKEIDWLRDKRIVSRHFFSDKEAVLMEEGVPQMKPKLLREFLKTTLARIRSDCPS